MWNSRGKREHLLRTRHQYYNTLLLYKCLVRGSVLDNYPAKKFNESFVEDYESFSCFSIAKSDLDVQACAGSMHVPRV